MTQTLPHGFIQQNRIPFTPDSQSEQVSLTDLIRLWRVHFSARRALGSTVGHRLEQFFWRILSSPNLRNLSEARIEHLYAIISRDEPIRTTPCASPLTAQADTRSNESEGSHAITDNGQASRLNTRRDDSQRTDRLSASNVSGPSARERSTSRPRPILRMPGSDAIAPGKNARILTPTFGQNPKGDLAPKKLSGNARGSLLRAQFQDTTNGASDNVGSSQQNLEKKSASGKSPILQSGSSTPKSSKKGPSVSVPVKKRKPVMPRRTSSQSNSSANDRSPKLTSSSAPKGTSSPNSDNSSEATHTEIEDASTVLTITRNRDSSTSKSLPSDIESSNGLGISSRSSWAFSAISSLSPNPQMRNVSAKSTLATGLTLASSTGSLQPFSDDDGLTLSRRSSTNDQDTISSIQEEQEPGPLPRSRSALNLLLQRDKRSTSEDLKSRRK